jgi:hypothetical protein
LAVGLAARDLARRELRHQAAFDGEVPLVGLVPGRYVLDVTARVRNGKPVTRQVPFSLR